MADAASPDTPTGPQPNPIAGRTEADGPLFAYDLSVYYPNEGGQVTGSGWTTAAKLAKRLRDEADQIEHIAGLLSLSGDSTQTTDGQGSLRSRASGTPDLTLAPNHLTALRDAAAGLNLKQVAKLRKTTKSAATMRLARARLRLRSITTAQAVYEATMRGLLRGVPRP